MIKIRFKVNPFVRSSDASFFGEDWDGQPALGSTLCGLGVEGGTKVQQTATAYLLLPELGKLVPMLWIIVR